MKKVLILPSTTGQGDLAIAKTLAEGLRGEFAVATAYFSENAHSPLLSDIQGEHILFSPASHPDHSRSCQPQLLSLTEEIQRQSADLVIALNESFFALGACLAKRPVIQLTHLFNRGLARSSRWIVQKAIRRTPPLPLPADEILKAAQTDQSTLLNLIGGINSLQHSSLLVRAVRKIRRKISLFPQSRLKMELVSRYAHVVGASYLSQLFCDSLIVHSIFPPEQEALACLNADRRAIGRSPVLFTSSISGETAISKGETYAERKTLLLTFGGIDHPITPGMERLLRLLDNATLKFNAEELRVLIVGRVTETKRAFFEAALANNALFKSGGIRLLGSLEHNEHLKLINNADLVMTQPGYSTICELVSMGKPFILFHGLAPYYEQYVNFTAANKAGTSLNIAGKPWLQVGEYGRFGSRRSIRENALSSHLASALDILVKGKLPHDRKPAAVAPSQYFVDAVTTRARVLAARQPNYEELAV